VLFGDQLAQLLGQENLATKILYGALAAAAVTVLRSIDAAHYEKIAIVDDQARILIRISPTSALVRERLRFMTVNPFVRLVTTFANKVAHEECSYHQWSPGPTHPALTGSWPIGTLPGWRPSSTPEHVCS
jgi:hypothetical protein